jgi:transposase
MTTDSTPASCTPLPSDPAPQVTDYAALLAIDWADQKHDLLLCPAQRPQDPEASTVQAKDLEAFFAKLRMRFPQGHIAVVVEAHRGALVHQLMNLDFVHLFPINPKSAAKFREALHPSGAKSDALDAASLLEFGRFHLAKLRRWVPDTALTRELGLLCEARRDLVNRRTELTNELTSVLKGYFPQALDLAADLNKRMAWDFLTKWDTLPKAQKTKTAIIKAFYYQHGSRSTQLVEKRLALLAEARPLTTDSAIVNASCLRVRALVRELRSLHQSIGEYDKRLAELSVTHPDAGIFSSVPGAGPCLLPRLIAAFGTDRTRWENPDSIATFSGVAPVRIASGNSLNQVRCRYACPRFLRQTFVELARSTSLYCDWAKEFYDQHRAREWKAHRIYRALAFKWIRILWKMWQERQPYDPARFQRALQVHTPLGA